MNNRRIFRCERGAIMVIALFFGVFLTGLVFHLQFIGQAILEHELAQDAADSVAFSAAGVLARGMNSLALINEMMATALAVLVAVNLLNFVAGSALATVTVACAIGTAAGGAGVAACAAIPPVTTFKTQVGRAARQAEEPVKKILEGLEKTADIVNQSVPLLAEAEAVYISRKEGASVSGVGISLPVMKTLPTQKGEVDTLCLKAGEKVVEVGTVFLPDSMGAFAQKTIGKVMGKMAGNFSGYFCGTKGSDKPSIPKRLAAYPVSELPECASPEANPDGDGQCRTRLCRRCTAAAYAKCQVQLGGNYHSARWVVEEKTFVNGDVKSMQNAASTVRTITRTTDPCADVSIGGGGYMCRTEISEGSTGVVTEVRYVNILSCVYRQKVDAPASKADLSSFPVHRVVDKNSDDETFIQRGYLVAGNANGKRLTFLERLLRAKSSFSFPARLTFAAARFESPHNDLWHMDWYARLIRFRQSKSNSQSKRSNVNPENQTILDKVQGKEKQMNGTDERYVLH